LFAADADTRADAIGQALARDSFHYQQPAVADSAVLERLPRQHDAQLDPRCGVARHRWMR